VRVTRGGGSQGRRKDLPRGARPAPGTLPADKIKRNIGFDVTIVTTAHTNEEAKSLLSELGMPFSDKMRLAEAAAAAAKADAEKA